MEKALCLSNLKVCGTEDFAGSDDDKEKWWDSAHNKEIEEKARRQALGIQHVDL